MNAFKIKNRYILGLASWLNLLPLSGRDSRERSRFVVLLSDALALVEKERIEIIKKFAEMEEDGVTPKKTVDNGVERYVIPDEKKVEMEKEYSDLLDEDFVLDVGSAHLAKIRAVRDIVLNTDYTFGPKEGDSADEQNAKVRQAYDYERWCESFEALEID